MGLQTLAKEEVDVEGSADVVGCRGKMRLSTPRVGLYKQNLNVSFGSNGSQGSNNSSASAGTRSPHVIGRRMGYSGDTAYKLSLNDV